MKKYLGIILVFLLVLFPSMLKAENNNIDISNYKTLGLKDVLSSEEIKEEFKSYSETDKQVPIYMFRGQECGYCKAFLNFLNSITDEYGKYFKLVSFESWYDTNNADLLEKVSEFLEQPAGGVPYIIIGDKVFAGYSNEYDEDIKNTIKTLYDSKERYDVFDEYNKYLTNQEKSKNAPTVKVIVWNLMFTIFATAFIIVYIKYSNNKLYNDLSKLNRNNTHVEKEIAKKEVIKKQNKKDA